MSKKGTNSTKPTRSLDEDTSPGKASVKAAPTSLSGLLDHFLETTKGQNKVAVSDLLNSLSSRSHGPMLLFPAIIAISPIGMIPGMSVATGTLIIVIAGQMMFFSSRPWIPKRIAELEFSQQKLKSGVNKTLRWVKWFEKVVRPRFEFLASGVMIYPIALISMMLAASFYPLAFVPLGVLAPGFAITVFALGLTARDGLLVIFGFLLTGLAGTVVWSVWPF